MTNNGPYRAPAVPSDDEFAYTLAEQIQREGARLVEAGHKPSHVVMGPMDYYDLRIELMPKASRCWHHVMGWDFRVVVGGQSCLVSLQTDLERGQWFIE